MALISCGRVLLVLLPLSPMSPDKIRQLLCEQDEVQADPASSSKRRSPHQYQLLGVDVGRDCLTNVLGISGRRLQKAQAGVPDLRFSQYGGGVRQSPKTDSIDKFLFQLHGTLAETLPTGKLVSIEWHRILCSM